MGKGKDRGSGTGTGESENALHSAARSGDLNAVQSILSSNNPLSIIVNSRDKHSRTPYPIPLQLFLLLIFTFFLLKLLLGLIEFIETNKPSSSLMVI